MKICVTIDMDNRAEYAGLVDPSARSGRSFYPEAIPRFLDLLDRHGIRSTFFMVGRDALVSEHRPLVRRIAERGHEIGNHSFSHPPGFAALSREEKSAQIDDAEKAIADLVGRRPVGFRTPSGDVDSEIIDLLAERDYLYDSSVIPSLLQWAFVLYGKTFVRRDDYRPGSAWVAVAPRRPYFPSRSRGIHRREKGVSPARRPIVEMPLSVVPGIGIPFYATVLRMLDPRFFRLCLRAYGKRRPTLHLLFHLIDLVDLADSALGPAMDRMPGLGVPFARRTRFVEESFAALARVGEFVTLREAAEMHLRNEWRRDARDGG